MEGRLGLRLRWRKAHGSQRIRARNAMFGPAGWDSLMPGFDHPRRLGEGEPGTHRHVGDVEWGGPTQQRRGGSREGTGCSFYAALTLPMSAPADITEHLWAFVRGDVPVVAFEKWVYAEPRLEGELGAELFLTAISTDFANREAVWSLRCALAAHARGRVSPDCLCIRLRALDVVDMGHFQAPPPAFEAGREWTHKDVFRSLERVADRGDPYWWLWAARCRACGQGWLVGQEERQNDVFCLMRLDAGQLREIVARNLWPRDFDSYETLLRIGFERGRRVRFAEPMTSSMNETIADLARARPGIAISEVARLLNLDPTTATEMARKVVERDGVRITFDSGS